MVLRSAVRILPLGVVHLVRLVLCGSSAVFFLAHVSVCVQLCTVCAVEILQQKHTGYILSVGNVYITVATFLENVDKSGNSKMVGGNRWICLVGKRSSCGDC